MPTSYTLSTLLLLGLPLLTFIGLWAGGRRVNDWAGVVATAATAAGLVVSILYADPTGIHTLSFNWIRLGTFTLNLPVRFDALTWLMLLLVHFVALLVQVYSTAYLSHERSLYRYFAFLQLFLFSMIGIILSGGLLAMYIFWELVGLSSYLLIGFWYQRPRAVWAAKKAFVLNRIGDAAFLVGILLLIYHAGTTDFDSLPQLVASLPLSLQTTIGLCLFGGCVGKSAQFPLSAWLPDAMEGPTPVSALIHAATMVAAGIFLLARIAFLLTPTAQLVIIAVGTITMLHGAVRATQAWDIKRVLAYSTISQLGLMVLAVGLGSWQIALFHLTTHAFFKAGLFLSAGSVIHAITPTDATTPDFDPQHMRNMGGLQKVLPITFVCFVVCAAALAGLPFFSGFLSKDAIFLRAFAWASRQGTVAYLIPVLAVVAAGFTAYYMTRQVWLVFMGKPRYSENSAVYPHESPATMWVPMALLAALSLFIWFSLNPFDADAGWFISRFSSYTENHSLGIPLLSIAVTTVGFFTAYRQATSKAGFSYGTTYIWKERWTSFTRNLRLKPRLLAGYNDEKAQYEFFLVPLLGIGRFLYKIEMRLVDALVDTLGQTTVVVAHMVAWFDRNITDGGVHLTVLTTRSAGQVVRLFQNGKIQSYFVVTMVGVFLLLLWIWVV
ncbi:NADH-quinone oxidoreductase subunit L [Telluribacter sp.]|jgi:NADH-quinone oxidoreductase subunit L|uniref:NADH-quinone oxidoreductase subunit 5 family protein n=1 Tax=Telluribacter sp. TaxID=1978767 RepID=UPI002E11A7CD|nr:NADH-quinone oxidoreductase subunit L [Telluribacter sp.]